MCLLTCLLLARFKRRLAPRGATSEFWLVILIWQGYHLPELENFEGICGFSRGQNASPRARNGLKTLVWASGMVDHYFSKHAFLTHV